MFMTFKLDVVSNKEDAFEKGKQFSIEKIKQEILQKKDKLLSVDLKKYKGLMIGHTPGLEVENIRGMNKNFFWEVESINDSDPCSTLNALFAIEFDFDWIHEAFEEENLKLPDAIHKNDILKEYMGESIQLRLDFFEKLLGSEKVGYLLKLIVSNYYHELSRICFQNKIKARINYEKVDSMSLIISDVPSERDVRFQKEYFTDANGKKFRIKSGHVDIMEEDHAWTRIEEVEEYTSINPELVTSGNIVKLMSFDRFFTVQYGFPVGDISLKEKIYLYQYLLSSNEFQLFRLRKVFSNLDDPLFFLKSFFQFQKAVQKWAIGF